MSVFFSLIHNQSQTQGFQTVMQSLSLIPHPAQQSNPMLKKMDSMTSKMMGMMLEMSSVLNNQHLALKKFIHVINLYIIAHHIFCHKSRRLVCISYPGSQQKSGYTRNFQQFDSHVIVIEPLVLLKVCPLTESDTLTLNWYCCPSCSPDTTPEEALAGKVCARLLS